VGRSEKGYVQRLTGKEKIKRQLFNIAHKKYLLSEERSSEFADGAMRKLEDLKRNSRL
jgi:hypothetical protein